MKINLLTYCYNDDEGRCKIFELFQKSFDKFLIMFALCEKIQKKFRKIASKKFRKNSENFRKKFKKRKKRRKNYEEF